MNRKDLRSWEVRLGPVQTVFLVGAVTGCMFCAFYLGFFSGQKTGFETALATNVNNLVKLPIRDSEEVREADEMVSEVYAKLNDAKTSYKEPEVKPGKVDAGPDVASIASTDEVSLNELLPEEPIPGDVAVQNGSAPQNNEKNGKLPTLGSLLPGEPAVRPTAKPEPAPEKVVKAEKAKPEPTSAPEPKVVEPVKVGSVRKGWYAQVAAPKRREDADQLVKQLRASGFSVAVETAQVKGQDFFRIVVGPEESKDHAERLVGQLKREKYLKGDPFIRMVK